MLDADKEIEPAVNDADKIKRSVGKYFVARREIRVITN
jgi:hypothetical protein